MTMSVEKEIVEGKIGTLGEYDVEFKDGKLVALVAIGAPVAGGIVEIGGNVNLSVSAKPLADKLLDLAAKLIPGDSPMEMAAIAAARSAIYKAIGVEA